MESLQAAGKIRISYPSVVTVLAACLLLLRGVPRLRIAAIHLEDGQIFFSQAHYDGLAASWSLTRDTCSGSRLIAALLEPFPVAAAPFVYAVAALLVHPAMLTPACRCGWTGLFPAECCGRFCSRCCALCRDSGNAGQYWNLAFVGGISCCF